MNDSLGADARLSLDLALTVRPDGRGGVADDLATAEGLTEWVRAHPETVVAGSGRAVEPGVLGFRAGDAELAAVREVRAAVRALFAHAVRPGEPSPADAARLLPPRDAVALLNTRAALVPTVPVLSWTEGADPVVRQEPVGRQGSAVHPGSVAHQGPVASLESLVHQEPVVSPEPVGEGADLVAALARAAIAFLASPDRQRLRACHAPRCVRYFLKDHPRQEWCTRSCGNRARVARHHERHKKSA
ncbi:CGNR zinc finger domain-containing protein [Streptomyces sp. NBC_00414]|uniref:CGNR zinc finger domain-containing protein n=1 Tax=Streptomyces sp. NBC_00414 TaxID=2975739 RepID=UPI002E1D7B3A